MLHGWLPPARVRRRRGRCGPLLLGFLIVAVTLAQPRARGGPLPPDRVEDFRQALRADPDPIRSKEGLDFRLRTLTDKAKAITSLGDLGRVLLLQEWRADSGDKGVAEVDLKVRTELTDRFESGLKGELAKAGPTGKLAAAALIAETAGAARNIGPKARFLRERLRGLAPELIRLTDDPDREVRLTAIVTLGQIQADPKVVLPALDRLLQSPDPQVRRAAASALSSFVQTAVAQEKKGRSGLPERDPLREELLTGAVLIANVSSRGLEDPNVEVRRLSIDAQQELASALIDLIQTPFEPSRYPPPGRTPTAEERARIQFDRGIADAERKRFEPILDAFDKHSAALARVILDPDVEVRLQARRVAEDLALARNRLQRLQQSVPAEPEKEKEEALGRTVPVALVPPGVQAVAGPIALREGFLPELVGQQPPEVVPPPRPASAQPLDALVRALGDRDVRGRLAALDAIEALGTDATPAIPALCKTVNDPDKFVRWSAFRILRKLAPARPDLVVPAIAARLNEPDVDVRTAALLALERYGSEAKAAVPALTRAAGHGDGDPRISAMQALAAVGTDAVPALPTIAGNLDNDNPRVRQTAADVLGRFGARSAPFADALRQHLSDPDPEVRRTVSEALLKILGK